MRTETGDAIDIGREQVFMAKVESGIYGCEWSTPASAGNTATKCGVCVCVPYCKRHRHAYVLKYTAQHHHHETLCLIVATSLSLDALDRLLILNIC